MTDKTYVTPQMKAAIGAESDAWESTMEATWSEHRRFIQAIMDEDPIYYDEEYAKRTRYGGIVCAPLFPSSVNRRPMGTPDPLTEGFRNNPEYDARGGGAEGGGQGGLPRLDLSHIPRMLNGGNEIEIFQYMKLGEKTITKTRIADIFQREGRAGRMVFIVSETEVRNDKGELLMISRGTAIRR
ncbi:MAG: MaoC family dehydratase N-terminal domain-containing protein [Chloroflexi bacterium]|nr:MaoC family dehydratase N-terminal domain-containing protein [Chloroflexota bacterium]MBI4197736.1 MaoC family dehydratase N-terminal domain-containing protein [Chloroflexota bacterium]